MSEVTRILADIESGDPIAAERLLPLVYEELRKLAAQKLAHENPGQTLQATALVHEAYLRLIGPANETGWNSRGHFFAAAAEAMRRILVERARYRQRQRHGGDFQRHDINRNEPGTDDPREDLLALNEAMTRLAALEPAAAEVVKLRYFAGLSVPQVAEMMDISVRTAHRHWSYAKAWLYQALREHD